MNFHWSDRYLLSVCLTFFVSTFCFIIGTGLSIFLEMYHISNMSRGSLLCDTDFSLSSKIDSSVWTLNKTSNGAAGLFRSFSSYCSVRDFRFEISIFNLNACGRYVWCIWNSTSIVYLFSHLSRILKSYLLDVSVAKVKSVSLRTESTNEKSRSSEKRGEPYASRNAVPPLKTRDLLQVRFDSSLSTSSSKYSRTIRSRIGGSFYSEQWLRFPAR